MLAATIDGRKMSFRDAPQTWLAAALCLGGVALLELGGADGLGALGAGDFFSVLQVRSSPRICPAAFPPS